MAAFTTVAAGIGLAATAGTTGMSFLQAGKQRGLQRQAESEATEAMAAARKKLDVNFYEQLAIQKEPYELEREALLSQGALALQAGVEGEGRGVAATAGRVQMAQQAGQAGIRSAMGQELMGLERLTAEEESRLRDMGVKLDLAEVTGAQLAARDAQEAANLATKQGFEGITSAGQQVAQMAPLYAKSAGAKQFAGLEKDYAEAAKAGSLGGQFLDVSGNAIPFQQAMGKMSGFGVDMSGVTGMKPFEFQDYMAGQKINYLKNIRSTGFGGPITRNVNPNTFSMLPAQYQIPTINPY